MVRFIVPLDLTWFTSAVCSAVARLEMQSSQRAIGCPLNISFILWGQCGAVVQTENPIC